MPKTVKVSFTLEINEGEPVEATDILDEMRDSAYGYEMKNITIDGKDLDTIMDDQAEPEEGVGR